MASLQTKIRILLLLLSFTILGALLYFSDIGKVALVISGANPYYIFLAFLLSLLLMAVRTFRWRTLLERIRISVAFPRLFAVYMSGLVVSNLTPGKIGDPMKSYILKKTSGISISKSLPSVFMERVFDVSVTVILSFIGIAIVTLPPRIEIVLFMVIALYFFGVTALLYISLKKSRIRYLSGKIIRVFSWLPLARKVDKYLEHFAEKFNESLVNYKDAPTLAKSFVLSLFIWSAEGVILYLCFLSAGIDVNVLVSVSFLSIAVLIGVTSLLPGGMGSSEVVMVLLFTTTYSLPIYSVTAAVLMERFFSLWINIIVGSVCMGSLRSNLK
jgi:uncharacterized protein (TIRG00374 family)